MASNKLYYRRVRATLEVVCRTLNRSPLSAEGLMSIQKDGDSVDLVFRLPQGREDVMEEADRVLHPLRQAQIALEAFGEDRLDGR